MTDCAVIAGRQGKHWLGTSGLLLVFLAAAPVSAQAPAAPTAQTPAAEAPSRPDAETLYREGRNARLAGKLDEAIAKLGAAAVIEPDNADIRVQLGLALAAGRRFEDAKRAFAEALRTAPDYDDAQLGLARTRFWNGELDAAEEALAPLRRRAADNADVRGLDAQLAAARAETSRAAAGPVSEPSAEPPQPGRRDAVRQSLAPVRPARISPVAVASARPAAALAQAQMFRRRSQFPEAEAAYRRAQRSAPRDADILVNLGLMQAFQGQPRFDDARASFTSALVLDPRSLDAKLGLARVDFYTSALDSAAAHVDAVLERKPDYTDALSLRARIRLARQDAGGAQADFEELLRRDPKDSDALVGLGDAQRAQFRDDEARATFQQAQGLAPASQDIARRLELPRRPRWRIDIDGSSSQLTRNFAPWKEGAIHIGYVWDERTTITVGAETDYQIGRAHV